jgi:hypothetical protein
MSYCTVRLISLLYKIGNWQAGKPVRPKLPVQNGGVKTKEKNISSRTPEFEIYLIMYGIFLVYIKIVPCSLFSPYTNTDRVPKSCQVPIHKVQGGLLLGAGNEERGFRNGTGLFFLLGNRSGSGGVD